MKQRAAILIAAVLLLYGHGWTGLAETQSMGAGYVRTDLVSNGSIWTPNWDSSLADPWGIACSPEGPWWVADEGRGRATLYTGDGIAFPGLAPLVVTIPESPGGVSDYSAPTGIVFNATDDFEIAPGVPAQFIFATRDGTVAAFNSNVDPDNAAPMIDNSPGPVYTGVAIADRRGENALYVANFRQGKIEVFGPDFASVLLGGRAFTDPLIPEGFSPFNIQNIGGNLVVTFANPSNDGRNAVPGTGLGFVDMFDTEGNLLGRLEQGPWMNAPWGTALAPVGFGPFSGYLLVGNSGSGRIAAFYFESGAFAGYLPDERGDAIIIPGLHALGFGNGGLAGPATILYFSAGFHDGKPNIFGEITPGARNGMPSSTPTPEAGPPPRY